MSSNCSKCNIDFKNREKPLECSGYCGNKFHPKCFNLSDYDSDLLQKKKNITFLCDDCVQFKKVFVLKIEEILKTVVENKNCIGKNENEIKKILHEVCIVNKKTEILNDIRDNCIKQNNVVESLAEKLKHNKATANNRSDTFADIVKKAPPLIIAPKTLQDCKDTSKEIKTKIDPVVNDIKVTSMKNAKKGAIVIECDTEEAVENFKNVAEEKIGNAYEIKVAGVRNPRLKIWDIEEEIGKDEVVGKIIKQNDLKEDSVVLKAYYKLKNKLNSMCAVVEVETEVYNAVMKAGKLRVGWKICKVVDGTFVRRCYKCLGYGHSKNECTSAKSCATCGDSYEGEHKCKVQGKRCINCLKMNKEYKLSLNVNHSAFEVSECEVYKRKLSLEKKKVF